MKEKVSLKDLSEFDRNYLLLNSFFSIIDEHGNNRNENQENVARNTNGLSVFEQVLTAVTHEILQELYDINIDAIPVYNINSFVVAKESDLWIVSVITRKVIGRFISGEKLNTNFSEEIFNWQKKVNSNIELIF